MIRRIILKISLEMERTLNPNHIPNSPPKLQTNDIKVTSNVCRTIISGEELCSRYTWGLWGFLQSVELTSSFSISIKYCFVLQSGLHFVEHMSNTCLSNICS